MSGDRQEMGAYAPPPEDYSTFDARDDEGGRRGPILFIAFVAVFGLFAVVVWNAYHLGIRDRNDPPLIEAAGDYRQAPDDPGGFQTPDQDVDVYDLADSGAATSDEDTDPPANSEDETEAELQAADTAEGDASVDTEELASQPADLRIEADDRDALNDLVESISDGDTPDNTSDNATPDPELVVPGPETTPDTQSDPVIDSPPAQPATSGNFVVQIAAFRSQEEAEDGWLSFTGRFPGMAAGRSPDIVRVDLGDRGIYHRLRIAAFETRDQAAEFCSSLSSQGQDCLVASR